MKPDNTAEAERKGSTPSEERESTAWEFVKAAAIALALALFIRTFMFQPFKIPSESMVHTLLVGDHLLVNKMVYYIWPPERGDIAVFRYPENRSLDYVKRIVGLPGETVRMSGGKVYINGEPVEEPYAIYDPSPMRMTLRDFGPVTVPEGKLFMMGDNRDNSLDSRAWGFLEISEIRGKAFIIHWSWKGGGFGVRWNRVGKLL